jgi:hypothetical protein
MPSTSKAQQALMGQAYAIKTGKMKPSELNPEYKDQIVNLAKSMSEKDLKDFAETKASNLPDKVGENEIPMFNEFLNEEKAIKDLSGKNEKPMVTGIAKIISRVKDPVNRKEMANTQIEDFKEEGIYFDYNEFLKLCNVQ